MSEFLQHLAFDPSRPLNFASLFFWGYFAVVLFGFTLIHKRLAWRNAYLFLVSIYFYYKTSYFFFFLLLFSTGVDYTLARWMENTARQPLRVALVTASVVVNLFVLFYFKYVYFFADAIKDLAGIDWRPIPHYALWSNAHFGTDFPIDRIALPVGISFYTFQCISYTVDVYRRQIQAVKNPLDFGFYISFFPQLVAGPIVRASDFIPQLYQPYNVDRKTFGLGLFWVLNGLLKKVFLADYLAVNFIDRVFAQPTLYSGVETMLALFGYSLQVYADFSGYTDVAIGLALWMGFSLTKNFNSPYKATNVGEFWQRWHMSLSGWLKDYVYIPLGGNRTGSWMSYVLAFLALFGVAVAVDAYWVSGALAALVALFYLGYRRSPSFRKNVNTNINVLLTMLLGGFWHGSSWNFVLWGGLNGAGLVVHKYWKRIRPYNASHWLAQVLGVLITFLFITFTRIWFRAPTWDGALEVVGRMTTNMQWNLMDDVVLGFWKPLLVFALGMGIHWIPEAIKAAYRRRFARASVWAQAGISVLAVLFMYQVMTADAQPFIYFQF